MQASTPPAGGWTILIDEILEGRWKNPITGEMIAPAPHGKIVIADSLDGAEVELISKIAPSRDDEAWAIVSDPICWDAMGARVAHALRTHGHSMLYEVILERPRADLPTSALLKEKLDKAGFIIVVGSGALNDLCKYVTAQDNRRYIVFATAPSMNGYTSMTASITLDNGLKASLLAHVPAGTFIDLAINATAPARMRGSGFGDCLCRSVAQVDCWMAHRLFSIPYPAIAYQIQEQDVPELNKRAGGLPDGDLTAIGYLHRVMTLSGIGVSLTGSSHHSSMGEHQISHYIDCFAGNRHAGSLHGEQVGVATLAMAHIQQRLLERSDPPEIKPTQIDENDIKNRMGSEIASSCLSIYRKKALDKDGAAALNAQLHAIWPDLRRECLALSLSRKEIEDLLRAADAPVSAAELGLPTELFLEAVCHGHEMRDRLSFADLACNAGLLEDLAEEEIALQES